MDKLEDLTIDEREMDQALLARILKPYVQIGRESGKVRFTRPVANMGIKEKILLYLLAKKAAVCLSIQGAQEESSPRELEKELAISGNSLRPILKRLSDSKLVLCESGNYWVANYVLPEIEERFSAGLKGGDRNG